VSIEENPRGSGFLYGLYQKRLRRELAVDALPHHVAMIIDGNRRWAKQRLLGTAAHGHGIQVVTLYLLSTDNLTSRNKDELDELVEIIAELAGALSHFRDWRIKHVGSDLGLPPSLITALDEAEERTATHTGLHVNLAVGYGGRTEIADAVRSIIRAHQQQGHTLEDLAESIDQELIAEHLYTGGQRDPDLVIRTSGEQRLSDFMLWQSAHSEFYFMEALGPDIREVDFLRALRDYSRRHRRFGG
jgi:short-chain Z-isoprenyl diphosphate synthase